MRLPYMTTTQWASLVGAMAACLLVYVFIWNKSKPIAIVILICAFAWVSYSTLDWQYWDYYFKVDWGSGGLRPTS